MSRRSGRGRGIARLDGCGAISSARGRGKHRVGAGGPHNDLWFAIACGIGPTSARCAGALTHADEPPNSLMNLPLQQLRDILYAGVAPDIMMAERANHDAAAAHRDLFDLVPRRPLVRNSLWNRPNLREPE